MSVAGIVNNKINRSIMAVSTVVTAALILLGGFSSVGAQAAGTYDCGTYGSSDYNAGDCSDTTTSTGSSGSSTSTGTSTTTTKPSSPSTAAPASILLNDFAEYTDANTTGKQLTVNVGQVINFNLGTAKKTITIKSTDSKKIVVAVSSASSDVTVLFGQSVKYDVDEDGNPDISIAYDKVGATADTATASFHALNAAAATSTPTTTGTGSTQNTSNGGTIETKSPSMWWIWLIPVVIGMALLVWALIAAKRRKTANASGSVNFNQF